jgi:hypothetical protein
MAMANSYTTTSSTSYDPWNDTYRNALEEEQRMRAMQYMQQEAMRNAGFGAAGIGGLIGEPAEQMQAAKAAKQEKQRLDRKLLLLID